MPRLIDADDFIAFWNKEYRMRYPSDMLKVALANFPTIDPSTLRPKGEWRFCKDEGHMLAECHLCGYVAEGFQAALWDFCPNCGADMREVASDVMMQAQED